jgi:outer membrane protein OmpA-like peptidoglycan-associated protein
VSVVPEYAKLSVLPVLLLASSAGAQDCALGQRYLDLAKAKVAEFAHEEAIAFLEQSIAACPQYEAYQQLGDLAAQSLEQADKVRAAEAFVAAHERAPTDAERARSLFTYARLLRVNNDPQNAYPLIKEAQDLDPSNADIQALSRELDAQIRNPTEDDIKRGFEGLLFRPLRRAAAAEDDDGAKVGATAHSGPAINIPINFEVGRTELDDETRPNVAKLANALANPSYANRRFVFVGHADVRGDEQTNLALSSRRAETIYDSVVVLRPELRDRVEIIGRGEYEPLVRRSDEEAHRANRRLQVFIQ